MDPIEDRLHQLGWTLPPPMPTPAGITLPFPTVHVVGSRAIISGHGPQDPDGPITLIGRIGDDMKVAQGYVAARLTALSILASLKRTLGSLDRVQRWTRVFGMVRCVPEFGEQPAVINGFSDLILELYGPEQGQHARSAIGVAALPFGIPVEIEGEVEIDLG